MKTGENVTFWTIYHNTSDFPGKYVLRPIFVTSEGQTMGGAAVFSTLESARSVVPPGSHRFPRSPNDDAVIVESWME